jgi:hypothetical protein
VPVAIEASWTEEGATVRETARPTGDVATWELARPPQGASIRLRISSSATSRLLLDTVVAVPPSGPITVRLD